MHTCDLLGKCRVWDFGEHFCGIFFGYEELALDFCVKKSVVVSKACGINEFARMGLK